MIKNCPQTRDYLQVMSWVSIVQKGRGVLKGADLTILIEENRADAASSIPVAGVVEVKSYLQSKSRLRRQLNRHIQRAKQGLRIDGVDFAAEKVRIGCTLR